MGAESSWSVRDVDPRARRRAREGARQDGVTVGEWINRKLLDDDKDDAEGRHADAPEVASALDRLSRRIEAAEHRSTLAITGIDQSVLGLVSRLQAAEGVQGDFQKDVHAALNDLREARMALAARIERLEADDAGARSLQALKSLDSNLARLADEVQQKGAETGARLDAVEQGLERAGDDRAVAEVARRLDGVEARVSEAGERLDAHSARLDGNSTGLAETRARVQEAGDAAARAGDDLQRIADKIGGLDARVDELGAQAGDARSRIDQVGEIGQQAVRGLADAAKSLDRLAGRLRGVESHVEDVAGRQADADAANARLAEDVAGVRERLGAVDEWSDALSARQDAQQAELREWMARHSDRLTSAEQATNTAIQALETSVSSLDDRVKGTEGRLAQSDKAQKDMGAKLDSLSREFADLVSQTRAQIADGLSRAASEDRTEAISARLSGLEDEINQAERKRAVALDRIIAEVERLASSFGENLAESELRTAAMVDERLADVRGEMGRAVSGLEEASRREAARLEQIAAEEQKRLERLADEAGGTSSHVARAVLEEMEQAADAQRRAIDSVHEKVDRVADEVRQRIATVEMNADSAVDAVSNRLTRLSENVGEGDAEALERRIRESESRTRDLLEEAMARVQRRVADDVLPEVAASSQVGEALEGLSQRLEAIERRQEDEGDISHGGVDDDAPLSPILDRGGSSRSEVWSASHAEPDDEVIFEDVGAGLAATPFDPDREALQDRESAPAMAEPDDLWDPFADEDAAAALQDAEDGERRDEDDGAFGAYPDPLDPEGRTGASSDEAASAYDDLVRRAAPDEPASEMLDMDAAPAAVDASVDAPGFGPADDEEEPAARLRRNGRSMMIAASGAAFLAVGAAAYMVASDSRESGTGERDDEANRGDRDASSDQAPPMDAGAAAPSNAVAMSAEETRADDLEAGDDPLAQYRLGVNRLSEGQNARAIRLMQRAADAGFAPAQFRLGQLYEAGRGAPQNYADARRWTERAAQAGHREAMHNLGVYYANGVGAPESYEQAARWFREAAQLGATDSQYNLGVLHEQGLGVSIDLVEAYAWYSIAAASGDDAAAQRARALASRLTASERLEGDAKAAQFTPSPLDPVANGVVEELDPGALSRTTMIAEAQRLLEGLGYNPGAVDGSPGPRTETAIIAFQRAQAMPETGRVDTTLLERLRAQSGL